MNRTPASGVLPRALLLALAMLMLVACNDASPAQTTDPAPAVTRADEHDDDHEDGDAQAQTPATRIEPAIAEASGIRVAVVTAGTIADSHEVQGLLTPIEGRVARIAARFPGPVRRLDANLGDQVQRGQVLAIIESNLSLGPYSVHSPLTGVVTARYASMGDIAGEDATLMEISDLSRLWVDLHVFGRDARHLRAGAPVRVSRLDDEATQDTVLDRVLPGTATASQSTIARAVLDNADGQWRPGTAVRARVTVSQAPAERVVPATALQSMDGREVVFVVEGDRYEARTVEVGQRDGERVEILSGVEAGETVVVEQSYLVKADIEKSGASHAH
ncbi:efflux RND transporter periplasmic adaptor subunit [Marilutibacter aestuarii]|uniref:Efflux RND transporter periplasmic adaptor subunit n=1 Tax=Marilutibacter aestuarii TaxID=1706195 RepID=A0A508A022_9GAMM|nr:efflux RND transporter periplasmic adaptor subunit [Lysobacter aestuarii]TQD42171.1 efflux RND transporter periplasmic adaptor subunit [Lysobacter aestuarii]